MKKSFTVIILLVSVSFMFGQTLYYVDGTNGTDDGLHGTASGTGAWATIQYAINNVSNPTTATVVINVASGTYTEPGIMVNRSFTFLAIVGASASSTIVQASADPNTLSDGVVKVNGSDENISFNGLTFRNGNIAQEGAGILNLGQI